MNKDKKTVTLEDNLNVTAAGARSYAERVKSADSVKGKGGSVGFVPPLDKDKMNDVAKLSGMPIPEFKQDIMEPPPITENEKIHGVGSSYKVNQEIAKGVDNPVSLAEAKKGLSQQSLKALEVVKQMEEQQQQKVEESQETVKEPEKQISITEETRADLEEEESALFDKEDSRSDDVLPFDLQAMSDTRSLLMNSDRKKAIEERLKPLSIADMIMNREIKQTVPIVKNQFEVTFRTMSQSESLWILQALSDYSGSELYINELLNTFRLACSIVAINGSLFPDHKENDKVSKDLFNKKLKHLTGFPIQLLADLSVQNIWFQERVTKLLTVDSLKNG